MQSMEYHEHLRLTDTSNNCKINYQRMNITVNNGLSHDLFVQLCNVKNCNVKNCNAKNCNVKNCDVKNCNVGQK